MEFFINQHDIEPTKRVNLSCARLVISRGAKLTRAQFARIDRDLGPSSPTVVSDSHLSAFYIDFPKKILQDVVSRDNTIYETRSVKVADNDRPEDFPLGFIMVSPSRTDATKLETALSQGCHVTIPRERKRLKVQRWMNRAWMKIRGELSIDQFDETTTNSPPVNQEMFFTIAAPSRDQVPRIDSLEDQWGEHVADGDSSESSSFMTAGEEDEGSQDDEIDRVGLSGFRATMGKRSDLSMEFDSIEAMLDQKSDHARHCTRIARKEILSVIHYVERTKKFSECASPGWSLCSEGENFDCFKSIDEATGIVRTRTWAKLPNVPPQTLFHILYNAEARKSWDHHYSRFVSEWTDETDPDLDIIDAVVSAPFGCANREFLEWRRKHVPNQIRAERTGDFVIYLRSFDDNRPVGKNNVRAEVWLSGYLIQWWKGPDGQPIGSEVLVMTQIDVKGLIPKYLVNALSSSGPKRWVKSVTAAAISEIENSKKMSIENVLALSDVELDQLYHIHG